MKALTSMVHEAISTVWKTRVVTPTTSSQNPAMTSAGIQARRAGR
jgi:hypothetical protein